MSNCTRTNSGNAKLTTAQTAGVMTAVFPAIEKKKRSMLVVKSLLLVLLCCIGNISVAQPTCITSAPSWANSPVTSNFNFTGALQSWTVPSGVTSITVDVQGAQGGGTNGGFTYQSNPGNGGRVQITGSGMNVTAGHVLSILVGGQGGATGAGGFGGGGSDNGFSTFYPGAGGGGYSSITDLTSSELLVVAGGGGGSGGYFAGYDLGGDGGGIIAASGTSFQCGTGGGGGSDVAGGSGTSCDASGTDGDYLVGGDYNGFEGSGGGGGGYYGGGSGGLSGGGGGGSSYTNGLYALGTVNHTQGYNTAGNGLVVINYTLPLPTYGIDAFSVTAATGPNLSDAGMVAAASSTTGYLDRTALSPITVYPGGSYASSITWGTATAYQEAQVWIDFNDNGTFEPSEEVTGVIGYSSSSTASPLNFNINIPFGAAIGTHFMRIRGILELGSAGYGLSSHLDPCLMQYGGSGPQYNSGDAADYMITIAPAPGCTGSPVGGTANVTPGSGGAATGFSLSLSGSTVASGLTYQWQSSADGVSGWTNISGATTITYGFTGITASTFYRCIVTCPASSSSDISAVIEAFYESCGASVSSWVNGVLTTSFSYTGAPQTWTVPVGTTSIDVDMQGGKGGHNLDGGGGPFGVSSGGKGGRLQATLPVSGGQVLNIYVGGAGADGSAGSAGGYNGGAPGQTGFGVYHAGGGGGATDIRIGGTDLASRKLVAGGGGGAGINHSITDAEKGGDGGGLVAQNGFANGGNTSGLGGDGATQSCCANPGDGSGGAGALGIGGTGFSGNGVGGGGGGYYGGGSGGSFDWSGGGGGSSYTDPSVTTFTHTQGYNAGDGIVSINYIPGTEQPVYGVNTFSVTAAIGANLADADMVTAADASTGYIDRTSLSPITLYKGGSYSSSLTWGAATAYQEAQVWIDFNDNGTFESSEEVTGVVGYNVSGTASTVNFTISIPSGAATGTHMMRVRGILEAPGTYSLSSHLDPCLSQYGGAGPQYNDGDIADYRVIVLPPPTVTATPSSLNFGSILSSTTSSTMSVSLDAFALTPAAGSLSLTAPANYNISLDGSTWTSSISLPYTAGAFSSVPLYVQFVAPAISGIYSGSITVTGGSLLSTVNIPVTGISAPPCSGTPTAGTAAVTPGNGSAATSFTLSLSGYTLGVGITYDWQSSADGVTGWADISGATNNSYSFTGITANTYYRCILACTASGSPATSSVAEALFLTCASTAASWANGAVSATFNYTGSLQSWTVPAGVTNVTVDVQGAQGGGTNGTDPDGFQSLGGNGGRVQVTGAGMNVTPGHVFSILVGGQGGNDGVGGFGGGGNDFSFSNIWPGSGGGGYSSITDLTSSELLIVAGGGGGGGGDTHGGDVGGNGGGTVAGNGHSAACVTGGTGGNTLTLTGGSGESCSGDFGGNGDFLTGGDYSSFDGSGGGGGGYYGGGSGAIGGGGGGGSSYSNPLYAIGTVNHTPGFNASGNGIVIINYLPGTEIPSYGVSSFSVTASTGADLSDAGIDIAADPATGYLDRTSMTPINIYNGSTTTASITWGIASAYQEAQVWIDFNDNGTYEPSEEVTGVVGYSATSTTNPTNFYMTIPSGAATGNHLMRVRGILELGSAGYSLSSHLDPCLSQYGGSGPEYNDGDEVDYVVNILPIPPCSGTPTAGTAVVSPTTGYGTTPFTLTLSGYTVAGGITFQWQSSPDGATWSDISGATNFTYSFTGITQNEYYQCVVTCGLSSSSATTASVLATFTPPPPTCSPTAASWVGNESFYHYYGASSFSVTGYSGSTLNDPSIAFEVSHSTGYAAEYGTYAPVNLLQDHTYSATLGWDFTPFTGGQYAQVWIDFNNDGTFDPSEEVTPVTGSHSGESGSMPMTVTIPATAVTGLHLMRVRAIWDFFTDPVSFPSDLDPCLVNFGGVNPQYYGGTATDYYVNIMTPPPVISATPNPITFPPTTTGTSSAAIPTTLTANYLVPSVGAFTVTAPAGFMVSSDGSTWVSSYTIPYTAGTIGGTLPATTVYIQFDPTISTSYSGNVTVDGGGITPTYDIVVNGVGAPACSGTPTAGTATVSPTSGNGTTPFTLTVSGYTVAGGISFQWQSSPDGTTWSNISGATLASYGFTGITQNEFYQCIVTCPGSGGTSTTASVMATFLPIPSCTPTAASWAGSESFYHYYGAASFSVTGYSGSTLNDASVAFEVSHTTGYAAEYGTYAPVNLLQDHTYSATLGWEFTGFFGGQYAQVWIDFNNDGTFDPSEEVTPVTGSHSGESGSMPMTVTIPATAVTGLHLMRVRAIWDFFTDPVSFPSDLDPCLVNFGGVDPQYYGGTATDYYVNIMTPPPVVSATPNPITFPPTTPGASSVATTTLTATYLVPSVGSFTVAAPAGFLVSSDGSTWVSSYTIPYTAGTIGGTLAATTVYIQFDPTAVTSYSGNVTVDGGGVTPTYDIVVNGVGAAACAGTPTAGTATVSPTSGNGTTPFTLSVSGYTVAGGVGFQWQSSPNGTTWSNISGATLATYSFTGISQNEYYQCIVTCAGSGGSSTTASVLALFLPTPSCTPTAASWAGNESFYHYYGAASFSVTGYSGSTLNDPSIAFEVSTSTGYAAEYGTYAAVDMQQNSGNYATLGWEFTGFFGGQYAQVWVDFNNDGTFSPSEEVTTVTGSPSGESGSMPMAINIPVGAAPGIHLMRVRAIWDFFTDLGSAPSDLDPCLINFGSVNPQYYGGTATDYYTNILCNTTAISGTLSTCLSGGTTALSDAETGGVWSSDNASVASIGTDGTVTGGIAGTANITYTIASTGCAASAVVTINAAPVAITGAGTVCGGSTITLVEASTGGTWHSSNTAIATVGSISGVVTGVASGTATIVYSNGCGADASAIVTVNAPVVSGLANICISSTTTLVGTPSGGTWISSNPSVATIDAAGLVTSSTTTGTTSITYTAGGCSNVTAPWTETVSDLAPTAILGTPIVCVGATTILSDAVAGGGWTSDNTAVATTGTDGGITGVSAGTANITYSTGCGSDVYTIATVNPSPAPITGIPAACVGQTSALGETSGGVTWTSDNGSVATVDGSGVVTGVGAGATTISATFTSTGCAATISVAVGTVYPSAIAITPSTSGTVCLGGGTAFTASSTYTTTLINQDFNSGLTGAAGGTWSVVNTGAASAYNWDFTAPFAWSDVSVAGDGTEFMGTNTDLAGPGVTLITSLLTPSFSTVGLTSATLTYNYYFRALPGADVNAEVDYSTDGGTTWSLLYNYYGLTGGSTSWVAGTPDRTIVLPPAMIGQPNVQVRFYYNSDYGWYWAVDNVMLTGTSPVSYDWSGISGATGLSCTSCATTTITPTATGVNTYSVSAVAGGCYTTAGVTVSVNTISAAPSNDGPACVGGTVTLSSNVSGTATPATYHWSGPAGFSASTANPVLSGITTAMAGTYNFTVTGTGSSCIATGSTTVSVNTLAVAPSNDGPACVGGTINLHANASGTETISTYSWSGPSYSSGSSDPTLSAVTTANAGTYTLTVSGTGSGCSATSTTSVVVNTLAVAPSNDGPACVGGTIDLFANASGTETITTYSWSGPTFTSGATNPILSSVTTANAGTYTLTVSGTGSGCSATGTTAVVVNTLGLVAGNDGPACVGGTVNLTASASGSSTPTYSWSGPGPFSSTVQNPLLTTSATTDMTGTYTVTASIPGCSSTTTTSVVINTFGITAANSSPACVGGTVNLTSTSTGTVAPSTYAWSGPGFSAGTQNTTLTTSATTDMTGTYTIVATGTGSGCSATSTTSVTINTIGITAGNDGPACIGGTINLTSTPSGTSTPVGYAWTGPSGFGSALQNTSVNSLTLAKAGTYTVTLTGSGSGCSAIATTNVVVQTLSISASNDGPTCIGLTIHLTSIPSGTATASGFTWSGPGYSASTQNTTLSSVTTSMSGVYTVTATAPGSGCSASATTTVSIIPIPAPITGVASICVGSTTTVSDVSGGGTWSSSNTGVATIGTSGFTRIVTGLFAGTTTISYSVGTGCASTLVVTVNANPVISGMVPICIGTSITLTDDTPGGLWTAQNGKATVGSSSGVLTGVTAGIDNITYTLPTGCRSIATATINTMPSAIGGIATVCQGYATTLNTISSGGTWSSSNPAVATATPAGPTTTVTGITAGTATISYTLTTGGCYVTRIVTVNALSPITGNAPVCQGSTITLSDLALGGVWHSTSTAIATVGSVTGVVTGIAGGTTRISYTTYEGCLATVIATVNPTGIMTGTAVVCEGATTTLTDATPGGTWSSSSPTNATVVGGVVTGVLAGTATISYTITSTGCSISRVVTVNPSPGPILGTATVCAGLMTSLSDAVAGGTWTSGSPGMATIDGSGSVTGVAAGTSKITYKITAGGCQVTRIVTVNTTPVAITANTPVCQSSTITLHEGTGGGSWSTTDAAASVGATTGIVTGLSAGTALISYSMPTGCLATTVVTVNPITPILGATPICVGGSVSLSDLTSGGSWTSSNPAKGSVDGSGTVTGLAGGTANITYTMPVTGCRAIVTETIIALPAAIVGGSVVCVGGSTLNLTDATAGGTWGSTSGAGVDGSGHVSGITPGTAVISYSIGTCGVAKTITVNASPASITGSAPICAGSTLSLVETVSGGTWSSSATAVATVSSTGVVTGVAGGTANISYVTGAGCSASVPVTVNTILPISGTPSLCLGSTTNLGDATPGGTWSSSDGTGSVSVGTSGVVTGNAVGTATVTYTTSSCSRSITVTVNAVPSSITGSLIVCISGTTALSDAGSGTWSSSNASVATIIGSTGVVTGVAAGTSKISFTAGSGCSATAIVTVNAGPSPIGGAASVCTSATIILSDFVGGGTWSTSDATITLVGAGSTASVTGVTSGTAIVSYTIGTCTRTRSLTVNQSPGPVLGTALVCVGGITFLSDATTPGITWTSDNTTVATVNASGSVTGVSAGTANITYMIGTGCIASTVLTVSASPSAILGNTPICLGNTIALSDAVTGGSWSSSNTAIASVDGSGNVTGAGSGLATITYSVAGGGCHATTVVTVTSISPITGLSSVCTGASIALTDASAGGTWTSTSGVTVGATGVVTGVTGGTATITYTFASGGCAALKTITVNTTPTAINGVGQLCIGSQLMLTDGVSGGSWTSSNSGVASVVGSTGVTTGIATGIANITYAIGGCQTVTIVTVTAAAPVTGLPTICAGGNDNMHNSVVGGVWSSSNPAVGTISTSGVLTSFIPGTTTVSYTLTSGCVTTMTVTVNPIPGAILGNGTVCVGGTLALSNVVTGGTWASSDGVVTIDGSGNVTTVATGTAMITYTAGGCSVTTVVTVGAVPSAIGGSLTVCEGASTTLYDATSGGVWSSTLPNGTVNAVTGSVTGITAGTTTISYVVAGCGTVSADVTINATPAAITGSVPVCVGGSIPLGETTSGGTWSTTSSHASVDVSGNVTAISVGTATISYTLGSCSATTLVTVSGMPAAITGPSFVCVGGSATLHDVTPGGLWSSADGTVSVGTGTGIVTGVSAGTATIVYTTGAGCTASTVINVNTATSPISGYAAACIGTTTALTDITTGGTWSSSSTGIATVAADGTVTGVAAGTATISYNTGGCIATLTVTISAAPGGISGPAVVCENATITLTNTTPGGTWSTGSSNISVDGSGDVTGLTAGAAVVTYTAGASCFVIKNINVNPAPAAITGTRTLCVGSTTFLTDATSGGVSWTSSNTTAATVTFTGVVTGAAAGTSTITYSITTGCYNTAVVTVNALPTGITGSTPVCAGSTISLTDAAGAGTWTSSNTTIASVGTDGTVTGVAGGTATISYSNGGCVATTTVTVSPILPINGTLSACVGYTTSLTDGTAGGHWSSSNTTVATVGSTTGLVSGLAVGTSTVIYTIPSGCSRSVVVTINSATAPITGPLTVCLGSTISLTDAAPGGAWISGSPSVATVGSTGIVSGSVAGTARITYAVGIGCPTYVTITVNPVPSGIGGSATVCLGSSVTLSDLVSGGDWISSSGVSVTTGTTVTTVTGLTLGTSTVTYTVASTGCFKTKAITVLDVPGPIMGALLVCTGATSHLTDATTGGTTWTSGTTSIATINSSGVVTGVAVGTSVVTYTLGTGCKTTATVTVHTCPGAPGHGGTTTSGTTTIFTGTSVDLADENIGGIWTSSNTSVVIVDGVGLVTGIAPGAANISHTVTNANGDVATTVTPVVVNSVPGDVRVVPNPNNGTFTVKGTLGTMMDEEVSLEVTDVLGQVLYSSKVTAHSGKISETITLNNTLANGMYMLNLRSGTENKVFHFVIEK